MDFLLNIKLKDDSKSDVAIIRELRKQAYHVTQLLEIKNRENNRERESQLILK